MATHYLTVSWEEFHRGAKALAEHLVAFGPWRGTCRTLAVRFWYRRRSLLAR